MCFKHFTWNEAGQESWMSLDKVQHFILHFFISFVGYFWLGLWNTVIASQVISWGTEIYETYYMGACIDGKDLCVNTFAMCVGIFVGYTLKTKL